MIEVARRDSNTAFADAVVNEFTRAGVTDACVAPGSRSTPLALALARDERMRVHVHLDERSAAFFALGAARASGRASVVLTTSGTATANLHPAVLEAHHGRVPLIVCTADRPPELRDTGAGQTVDQSALFGDALRWHVDPGPPEDRPDAGVFWRAIAARAVATALGPVPGPVHLNLPFREPLVPTGDELVPAPGRSDGAPWVRASRAARVPDAETVTRLAAMVRALPRGVLAAGWGAEIEPDTALRFAEAAGWPVLADPLSGLRVPSTVSTYDPLLRDEGFARGLAPELVVRVGAPFTNKIPIHRLSQEAVHQVVVDPHAAWLDPGRAAAEVVQCDAEPLLAAVAIELAGASNAEWHAQWNDAERRARGALDGLLDSWEDPFEGRVARDLVAGLPDGSTLAVASSMPVRDVESFSAPRDGVGFLANRGVNGIDGFTSTVLGAASMASGPVVALLGDLCFLHDSNGLLGATERRVDAVFVVVDNDGGGIFSFLPQADDPEHFEQLFGTPHGVDLAALAAVHDVPTVEVEKAGGLMSAVADAIQAGGVRVVLVRTDRTDNVTRHREAWAVVAAAR